MSDGPRPPTGAFEFTEAQKDRFRALAASVSFVGVCTMLFGGMAVLFAFGAVYSGFAANGAGLGVGAALLLVMAWWTVSAGRSLSALVVTKGRDVERLMEASSRCSSWGSPGRSSGARWGSTRGANACFGDAPWTTPGWKRCARR
jgi:hypothetical protein